MYTQSVIVDRVDLTALSTPRFLFGLRNARINGGFPLEIGDPHITGFSGQKFTFTGDDGTWYVLISDPPSLRVNIRVTAPVPSLMETTYITGFVLLTTDDVGLDHIIVVTAKNPHGVETTCSMGVSPCLADGSLTVLLDGKEALAAPGTVSLASGIKIYPRLTLPASAGHSASRRIERLESNSTQRTGRETRRRTSRAVGT